MRLMDLMTGAWAILPETLAELQQIYLTHLRGDKIDIAAIEARLGRPLANEQQRYTVEPGGVGLLRAAGVMSPKASLLMQVSGGISTQVLAQQINSMAADPRVRSVVFAPDSPGGNVLGVPAAARALRALAEAKPTVTVVEGVMASAMAWVGTGANAVFIEGETDMVGSLGVISRIGWDQPDPNAVTLVRGRYKRASVNGEPPSAEYLAYAEQQLDYLYTLLVDAVAANRGVSSEQVLEHMADGRVFIGRQAIDAGLVDGVSTVDAMVEQLATDPSRYAQRRKAVIALGAPNHLSASAGDAREDDSPTNQERTVMPQADTTPHQVTRESLERDHAALFASLRSEFMAVGATAECDRIRAVLAQGEALPGHEALVRTLAFDGKTTGPEAAAQIVAAEGKARKAAADQHAADAPPAAPSAAAPADKPLAEQPRAVQAKAAAAYAAEHKVSVAQACAALGIDH